MRAMAGNLKGSSPHTRGAHRLCNPWRLRTGIIPAYAGSTASSGSVSRETSDHPRIRGEHSTPTRFSNLSKGSSPHTRGAHRHRPARRHRSRIIPAYAGSTSSRKMTQASRADHPRIRGEHNTRAGRLRPPRGSSPHTRGARIPSRRRRGRRGIIPAYAGSTRPNPSALRRRRDHPRIRGEHAAVAAGVCALAGSSPHTRGARLGLVEIELAPGIIPAYAGSTSEPASCRHTGEDHPRIRGEHGTRTSGPTRHIRIIPAYAGSTNSHS